MLWIAPAASQEGRPPRKDLYGDPLPPDAVARMGTVRLRHGSGVTCLAVSPDGRKVAAGGSDGTVRLWDVATGRLSSTLEGKVRHLSSVTYSRDGTRMAAGSGDGTILVWDPSSGRELARIQSASQLVRFSPDGETLVSGGPKAIETWNAKTGARIARQEVPEREWSLEDLSADGSKAVFRRGGKKIHVWDVKAGREGVKLPGTTDERPSLALSPDGATLAVGDDGKVSLVDLSSGALLRASEKLEWGVDSLAFSPDGKFLAGGCIVPAIAVWETSTLEQKQSFRGGVGYSLILAFSPDGSMLASGGDEPALRLLGVAGGNELLELEGHTGAVRAAALSADGKTLVTGGEDSTLMLWEAATGRRRSAFRSRFGPITSAAYSRDGSRFAVADEDHKILVCDGATGDELMEFTNEEANLISCLAFSPDGKTLASGDGMKSVCLWDLASGRVVRKLEGPGDVNGIAFSPDGRLLACAGDDGVRVWDVKTFAEALPKVGKGGVGFNAVAIAPEGGILAAGQGRLIRLWDLPSGLERNPIDFGRNSVGAIAFSPKDGLLAVALEDGTIRLREIATGKERRRFTGHRGSVTALSFSSDGRWLASGSADSTALLWDLSE